MWDIKIVYRSLVHLLHMCKSQSFRSYTKEESSTLTFLRNCISYIASFILWGLGFPSCHASFLYKSPLMPVFLNSDNRSNV